MNKKLMLFSGHLELCGVLLLLFSALRADSGLAFWLIPALAGMTLALVGLGLSWLCSPDGLSFRRRTFGTAKTVPEPPLQSVIFFPKAS